MNIKLNFLLVLFYTSIVMGFINCKPLPFTPSNEFVTFCIKDVIIGGNTDDIIFNIEGSSRASAINFFEFKISTDKPTIFYSDSFILSEGLVFNKETNRLELISKEQLDEYYTYRIDTSYPMIGNDTLDINGVIKDIYTFDLYDVSRTCLYIKSDKPLSIFDEVYHFGNWSERPFDEDYNKQKLVLRTNTSSDIVLKYNLRGESKFDGIVDFSQEDDYTYVDMYSQKRLFNYNAEWENISKPYFYNYPDSQTLNNMINIVFLADMFDSSHISNYTGDVKNKLLKEIQEYFPENVWDNINVFKLNTISLDDGTKNIIGINYADKFGDSFRIKKLIQTSFIGGPLIYIDENNLTNIDLIVIVTNDNYSTSIRTTESSAYLKKMISVGNTNIGKDVHIIRMPYDRFGMNNHLYSLTSHLRELWPEYKEEEEEKKEEEEI